MQKLNLIMDLLYVDIGLYRDMLCVLRITLRLDPMSLVIDQISIGLN